MTCPAVLRTDAALDTADVLRRVVPATARRLGHLLSADDGPGQFAPVRAGGPAQWQGGAVTTTGIAATTAAVVWSSAVIGAIGPGTHRVLVAAVTGVVGLGCSTVLRWVFVRRPGRGPAVADRVFAVDGNRAQG